MCIVLLVEAVISAAAGRWEVRCVYVHDSCHTNIIIWVLMSSECRKKTRYNSKKNTIYCTSYDVQIKITRPLALVEKTSALSS